MDPNSPHPTTPDPIDPDSEDAAPAEYLAPLPSDTASPPPARSRRGRRVIALLVGIFVLALAIREFPREVARWYAAAAMEQHLNGELDAASTQLESAFRWNPHGIQLLLLRAQWKLDGKDYQGALADAEQIIALAPGQPAGYFQRSLVRQQLGQHREAVEDYDRLAKMIDAQDHIRVPTLDGVYSVNVFNNRAYARAVGGFDLEKGLEDVQQAIESEGRNAMYLDTRGFLRYRLGQYEQAREDLDVAVKTVEQSHSYRSKLLAAEPVQEEQVDERILEVDVRRLKEYLESSAKNVAIIRYHRALILEKLGVDDEAAADQARVRELGFTPGPDLF